VFRSSYKGQGYDVVDYFSINPALGTAQELQHLITTAKNLEMRVLFDLVLNHTSIQHPYAQDRILHGENSHYSDYYQTENDGTAYSEHYNRDANGFYYYFWEDLVNLNYDNEEVQRWMLEVCKHWIQIYDIDGYRFDAIWGVNARNPSFARRMRTELKSLKPEFLLLAEDKGSDPEVYALGFDAAFDWAAGRGWVSQWSWEYEYSATESKTIFNNPNTQVRGGLLKGALFQNKDIAFRKLRFLENNDVHRFIQTHGLERTIMAASLLFAVPGIPMLYNGQEIGFRQHPYVTNAVFFKNTSIESLDQEGLFYHYQKLIQLKNQYPALRDTTFNEVSVAPQEAIVAFHRWHGTKNFIVVINLNDNAADANINLSGIISGQSATEDLWLHDVLTENIFSVNVGNSQASIPMEGYSVRWLLLNDEGTITSTEDHVEKDKFGVFPNPSNGTMVMNFPDSSFNNLKILDVTGRIVFEEILELNSTIRNIEVQLPSKIYFLQIGNEKEIIAKRIIINNN
ncbi:MAG: alpha-amylase family glycosyl hydrolase, partial [Bacteroidota bacterium]|nr:alpha-amylase family glycosyl hydrolase [Bacteroidota bacterium]